ncbi:hypothetical protein [Paraburkholderia aromaticivorans]|jgi:hypothetical protein|uniref:hypothetical protein n=2 Tax=Burkholderiales TaxID=80840 RepID=UPI0038B96A4D
MRRESASGSDISTNSNGGMETKRSRVRRQILCPPIGALLRYQTRIVRVVAEARGQRAMIESLDTTGRAFVSTVKWASLCELGAQLF